MRRAYGLLLAGILALLVAGSGCTASDDAAVVKTGDRVKVHYTGTLANGTVFDSSDGGEPLRFTVGTRAVIVGFDEGVVGMRVGETKTLHIPVDRAYGPHREDLVFAIDSAGVPDSESLAVGQQVWMTLADGRVLPATVAAVSADTITVDMNHRLAGEDLTFTVTLVEIEE
ncbi:peptidylprolyl isomerase [Methanoculleus sp. Wushi-C6]|uniref:Peptidyl-prolyl cis-trans isomerase n=1 Tax=Methanoculleus caldifontis TaxID=2651577 RepID=A0ABU3X2L7_9EURY|nr:FKBP-type peptidyl-prolyl cis-trans isomerase [Methanoculleus sp. Wushi-C6]MDV2482307.1 peptidylprolyl isomerase [Methanoculleus sp. Wushi-C6]